MFASTFISTKNLKNLKIIWSLDDLFKNIKNQNSK